MLAEETLKASTPVLDAARDYVSRGWKVLPVWPVRELNEEERAGVDKHDREHQHFVCACPLGSDCDQGPGKHPVGHLVPQGLRDATDDVDQVEEWWDEFPDASVGICLRDSGLFAIDVDEYHGDEDRMTVLEKRYGVLPSTLVQMSGSGKGYHVFFNHPECNVRGSLGGVTIRSRNYVVAAPSQHVSGGFYEWTIDSEIADLPAKWLEALRRPDIGDTPAPVFDRDDTWPLERRLEAAVEMAKTLDPAIEGSPSGGTDMLGGTYTFLVTQKIVRGFHLDPEYALEILREHWNPRCAPPWEDAGLFRKCQESVAKGEAVAWGEYLKNTPDQLAAVMRGITSAIKRAWIPEHSIISASGDYYVYDFTAKHYYPPKKSQEIPALIRDIWKHAPKGVEFQYVDIKGNTKNVTVAELLARYMTVPTKTICDVSVKNSFIDPDTRIFYQKACQIREDLKPVDDPKITEWLTRLVGAMSVGKLLDWIACVPRLTEPVCALYLEGASRSGKGLLSKGLARLWGHEQPVRFENVVGTDFNNELLECPLIWIDESIPRRRGDLTGEIRSLVATNAITINTKFMNARQLRCAPRLIVCANNQNVLVNRHQQLEVNDLNAIALRFMHLHCGEEGTKWLNANKEHTKRWATTDAIAEYCLHLHATRKIVPGDSFLVEGETTEMHRKLMFGSGIGSTVLEWVVRFCSDNGTPDAIAKGYALKNAPCRARIHKGRVLINAQAVVDYWDVYIRNERCPSAAVVGRALSRIADSECKIGGRHTRINFREIKLDVLLEWVMQTHIGDEDIIKGRLENSFGKRRKKE